MIVNQDLISLGIGIIGGILTYAIIGILENWLKYTFQPWYEARRYGDIMINDVWTETYLPLREDESEDEQAQIINLHLDQSGHTIRGVAEMIDNPNAEKPVGPRKMKITGIIRNRHVSLSLELNNKKKFGIVNYLLEVTSEGDEMTGFTSYYNPVDRRISTAECILKRIPNSISTII